MLFADGSLRSKALAARVFPDEGLRRRLNAITHPRIGRLSAERIASVDESAPYVLYDAPLLVENGLHRTMRALIVVALDPELQVVRARQRDQMSELEAKARIAAQAPLEQKLAVADYVIDNRGELPALQERVAEVHRDLLVRLGGPG